MKKCINCKFELNTIAKFCPECGTKQEIRCPSCDASVPQDAKFCPECGTKIELSTASSALTSNELERIDINENATGLERCEIRIITIESEGPDEENQYNITVNYEVTNNSRIDWALLHTTIQVFSASGKIVDQLIDRSEELISTGQSRSKSETIWSVNGALFDGAIENMHAVIAITASELTQEELNITKPPITLAEPQLIDCIEIAGKIKLISGHITRIHPEESDDDDDQLELKLSIQNTSSNYIPLIWAGLTVSNIDEEELVSTQDEVELLPGDFRIINTTAYVNKSEWASLKISSMLTVLQPVAIGIAQIKGSKITKPELDERDEKYDAADNFDSSTIPDRSSDSVSISDEVVSCKEIVYSTFKYSVPEFQQISLEEEVRKWSESLEDESISAVIYEGSSLENKHSDAREVVLRAGEAVESDSITVVAYYYYEESQYTLQVPLDSEYKIIANTDLSHLKNQNQKYFGTPIDSLEVNGEEFYMEAQNSSIGTVKSIALFRGVDLMGEWEIDGLTNEAEEFLGDMLYCVLHSEEIPNKGVMEKSEDSVDLPDPANAAFKKLEVIIDAMGEAAARAKFYIKPNIPEKKLHGAIASYAQELDPKDIIMLFDSTVFGGGGEGVIFTNSKLFGKDLGSPGKSIKLSQITSINYKHSLLKPQLMVNEQHFAQINNADKDAMIEFTGYVQQWADILKFGR